MQSLDVISVNFWQIAISLCNLLLLFLILKKFLYQPVRRVLAERHAALEKQYAAAEDAKREADNDRKAWEEKMRHAQEEADRLLEKAEKKAELRETQILLDARDKADGLVREAEAQAALEKKKAQSEIKKEIVDVSAALTEKIIRREIRPEDHRDIIDSIISEIGEDNAGDQ